MFTHWSPMRSTCLITCSSAATSAQVAGHGRLQRQQRQDALVDLQVAPVDAVVVVDDDRRQLDVLVLERLERAVERRDDEVERPERLLLELAQLLLEVLPAGHDLLVLPVSVSRTGR